MLKLIPRVLLLPLMLLAILGFASPASAADGWLPSSFDTHQRVYVDPALGAQSSHPVNVDGLEQQLDKLSADQGVQFYFVYAQKGSGQIPPQYGTEYASWQLDMLINDWANKPGFPAGKAVVIMVVRSDRNLNSFSLATNGGSGMKVEGFDKNFFSGDFTKSRKDQFLPNDVKGYVTSTAEGVNARYAGIQSSRAFQAMLPYYIVIGLILAGLLGGFLFLLFRYLGICKKLKAKLDEWSPKMDSVTQLYQQLSDPKKGYLDFITDQAGRREKFEAETRTLYDAKIKDYTDFRIRRDIAGRLFGAASDAYTGRSFFKPGALFAAYATLTDKVITVTGKEKELRDITDAFGGTVEKQEFQPDTLLVNINALFVSVNSGFAQIMDAFARAEANKGTISATLAQVGTMEKALVEAGLTFAPYKPRQEAIATEAAQLLADISRNPVGKLADSNRLNDAVVDLAGDIEKCIAIKQSLPETVQGVATVRTRVAEVRAQASKLSAYPLVKGEEAAAATTAGTLLLNEKNANPDDKLGSADKNVAACDAALQAGEWEQAQAAKEAAQTDSFVANALVDTVIAAKAFVEKHVTIARANLGTLTGKLGAAATAVATLRSDFLAANFEGWPAKVDTAQSVSSDTEGELGTVRTAYYEQRFVAARAKLESIEAIIASADAGIAQVHAKLKELQAFRQHAKTTSASADSKSVALKDKRRTKEFTTSERTDTAHKQLTPKVAALHVNVQPSVADWPALASEADELVRQLDALDAQVDAQEASYKLAKQKVQTVRTKVQAAETACQHRDVLQPAKTALTAAASELQVLETTLATAKSDWNALAQLAEQKATVADKPKELAEQDVEDAGHARTAVASAQELYRQNDGSVVRKSRSVGGSSRSFSEGLDLSQASAELEAAETALRSRQWKSAKTHANNVGTKVQAAESAADDAVDMAIAAAITAYNLTVQQSQSSSTHSRNDDGGGFGGGFGGGGGGGGTIETGNCGGSTDSGFSSSSSSDTGNSGGVTDSNF